MNETRTDLQQARDELKTMIDRRAYLERECSDEALKVIIDAPDNDTADDMVRRIGRRNEEIESLTTRIDRMLNSILTSKETR